MSEYNWEFPSNNSGKLDGFNDSGLRSFRSDEGIGLAIRECIQNSIDARHDPDHPVKIDVSLPSIPMKDFPDLQGFKNILESCRDYKYAKDDPDCRKFYKNALELIKGEYQHCNFIKISDFNTKGLKKDLFEEVFIKGGGITQKADSGAAGSHGIGKNAVFNLSQFRTAFYASIDIDNQSSFFGKSILQSHLRSDNETSQGTGYFSEQPENKPILKRIDKLAFLNMRKEPGLDVFVAAFEKSDHTKDSIIIAVIEHFYPAIHSDNLVVNVMGQKIEADNLPSLVKKYSEKKYQTYYLKQKRGGTFPVINFYQTLISTKEQDNENLVENSLSIMTDNDVLIKTLKNDGKNRVHYFRRSGMIVKNSTMQSALNLTTIVAIKGDKLNDFLEQLENVKHDDWEVGQVYGEEDQQKAKKFLALIQQGIKENINEFNNQDSSDEIDMSGAAKYLQDDLDDITNQKNPSDDVVEEDELEKTITEKHKNLIIKKPKKKIAKKNKDGDSENYSPNDEGDDEEYDRGKGGKSRRKNKKLNKDDEGDIKKINFQKYTLNKIRLISSLEDGRYAFSLSSKDHINCYFSLHAISEGGGAEMLEVSECLSGNEGFEITQQNTIVGPIALKANQDVTIHIALKEKARMALQLNAFVDSNE